MTSGDQCFDILDGQNDIYEATIRGLDVPTAKLFLIPTGKRMVPAGSSWFLLVVPVGRLCGSYWSAYGFCC
ncbi:hypothetical protein Tco_0273584 [Tanacetum coccineum]